MRVNIDDTDTDVGGVKLHDGVPYTGEIVETDGEGNLVYLNTYSGGYEDGPYREWFYGGGLKAEGQVKRGRGAVGVWRTWYENGQLATEDVFDDHGKALRRRAWDENGTLTKDRSYPPKDEDAGTGP